MPQSAAFPESEGPGYLALRGQGGEEIALAVFATTLSVVAVFVPVASPKA